MTADEFRGLFKAMGITNAVAGWLAFITCSGLFIALCVAGRESARPDVDFRWQVFWTILIPVMLPAAAVLLNSLLLGARYLLGKHPDNKRLSRRERRAVRKALAEKRSAAMERELAGSYFDALASEE